MNKIRNEKQVTISITEIQIIIREYYEQLYANKLDNLEEMDKFLETYNLLRLNQEEINNLKRSVTSIEIEAVIKKLPTNTSPGSDRGILLNIKRTVNTYTSQTIPKTEEERKFPHLFYMATFTLIPKPDKDTTKKKKERKKRKERKLQTKIPKGIQMQKSSKRI